MTELQKQILKLLKNSGDQFTADEISSHLVASTKEIRAAVADLSASGEINKSRNGRDLAYSAKEVDETIAPIPNAQDLNTEKAKAKIVKRNKPFTPNGTLGYLVEKDKVRVFLERRASSKTLTLTVDDLHELVTAVQKAGMVNHAS